MTAALRPDDACDTIAAPCHYASIVLQLPQAGTAEVCCKLPQHLQNSLVGLLLYPVKLLCSTS